MSAKPSMLQHWPCACLALMLTTVACHPAWADEYRYDTVHSQILVSASHDGYSNPVGRLHLTSGWLRFDTADWSNAATALSINLASIDMGDADWNSALCDPNYLDCAQRSTARFVSDHVQRTGPNTGIVFGTLSLRGISQPLAINFTLNRLATTIFGMHRVIGFSGTVRLDRTAFGMTANTRSVGTKVNVRLEIEAIRTGPASDHSKTKTSSPP
ncbi:MAG: YceI family protein [Xanthomonadales bacterium]|nr:YceI family protein [Xanthomonadales bacterium]